MSEASSFFLAFIIIVVISILSSLLLFSLIGNFAVVLAPFHFFIGFFLGPVIQDKLKSIKKS